MDKILENTIKEIEKRNMKAFYVKNINEMFDLLNTFINKDTTTGSGDSITLEELGVFKYLEEKTIFNNKHLENLSKKEKRSIYLNNFDVDIFFTGVNSISENGELVFIDGNGSRVAPIIYGPKKVVIITSTNKICKNLNDSYERARQIAAILDAKRLNKKIPCVKINKCIDCRSIDRICNSFTTISHQFDKDRINVIFIDGVFGY